MNMDMNIWLIIDGNQENDLSKSDFENQFESSILKLSKAFEMLENGLKLKLKIVFQAYHIVKIGDIHSTCKSIQIVAFPYNATATGAEHSDLIATRTKHTVMSHGHRHGECRETGKEIDKKGHALYLQFAFTVFKSGTLHGNGKRSHQLEGHWWATLIGMQFRSSIQINSDQFRSIQIIGRSYCSQ